MHVKHKSSAKNENIRISEGFFHNHCKSCITYSSLTNNCVRLDGC